jgi:hypothetical protein
VNDDLEHFADGGSAAGRFGVRAFIPALVKASQPKAGMNARTPQTSLGARYTHPQNALNFPARRRFAELPRSGEVLEERLQILFA